MKTTFHKAQTRGQADYGWLKTNYSFSFSSWFNPNRMGFGLLRVLNDDEIAGGGGFDTHPHKNMEIITIPLAGALAHKDSTGHEEIIRPGEVQVMSAGSGVYHSEYNASDSEPAKLFQIWIMPDEMDIPARYDQKEFDPAGRNNAFQTVVSNDKNSDALWINQDAQVSLASIDVNGEITYTPKSADRGVYFLMMAGNAEIAGEKLERRDAVGVTDAEAITIKTSEHCEVLAIEVPMH